MENQNQIAQVKLASLGKRAVNLIIDGMFCGFLTLALSLLGAHLDKTYGFSLLNVGMPDLGNIKFSLFQTGISIVYYGLFETLSGRTLGKLVTETRVVMRDGTTPGNDAILIRTLCRQIPLEFLSFLFSIPIPIGWHDMLSKTLVVDNYDYMRAQKQKNNTAPAETENKSE
jgi:uncharacterized RDD family membrane protein YckC